MIDLASFLAMLAANPLLLIILLLTLGATVVNGATDAPNAIATVVGTKCLSPNKSIAMAAVGNFVGLAGITMISSAVASTIFGMVDFGGDTHMALLSLAAAMIAIISWGVLAWYFGIPSSQSHSLIAGITGAAIALQGGFAGINWDEWVKVIYGLLLSTGLGFGSGWLFAKIIQLTCRGIDRRKSEPVWRWAQIISAFGVAVLHGAQDGQKFLSISMLGILLCMGTSNTANLHFPFWLIVVCSLTMSLGTAVGGKKIIKSVGMKMVKMEPYQGFAACMSAVFCIALATFTGMPVSTTHTKTTAIMGVGTAKSLHGVKWSLAWDMVLTWILTFPCCGAIGYVLALLFMAIF
ncbi:MAG: inorganic phosphate transporter [Coriobacteriales bacterium]